MSCLFFCYISYHYISFQSILKNSNNLVLEILNKFEVDTLYFKLFNYLKSNYYFTIRYSESIKGNSLLKTVSIFQLNQTNTQTRIQPICILTSSDLSSLPLGTLMTGFTYR